MADGDDPWPTPADDIPTGDQQSSTYPNTDPVTPYGDDLPANGVDRDISAENPDDSALPDKNVAQMSTVDAADPPTLGPVDNTDSSLTDVSVDQCASGAPNAGGTCSSPLTGNEAAAVYNDVANVNTDSGGLAAMPSSKGEVSPEILASVVTTPEYTTGPARSTPSSKVKPVGMPKALCSAGRDRWAFTRFEGCQSSAGRLTVRNKKTGAIDGTMLYIIARYVRVVKDSPIWEMHTYIIVDKVTGAGARGVVSSGGFTCTSKSSPNGEKRNCLPNEAGTGGVTNKPLKVIEFDGGVQAEGLKPNNVHQLQAKQTYLVTFPGAKDLDNFVLSVSSLYVWCDQALKGTSQQGCRIQNYVPTLTYKLSGTAGQVAQHVKSALGSGLPSRLTRLNDGRAMDANGAKACPSSIKRPASGDWQCDEYPFRSSRQGAKIYGSMDYRTFPGCQMGVKWMTGSAGFSRCFVNSKQNGIAGNALNGFLNNWWQGLGQRILDGEPYNVAIAP